VFKEKKRKNIWSTNLFRYLCFRGNWSTKNWSTNFV